METVKEKGWIKVNRSVADLWLWNEEEKFSKLKAWMDILLGVNYKPGEVQVKGELIVIEPGSMLTSITKLAEQWNWDRKTVSNFLKALKSRGLIDYWKLGKGIVLKGLSYENDIETDSQFPTSSPHDGQFIPHIIPTSFPHDGQINPHIVHTIKESNKENKDKNVRREEDTPRAEEKLSFSENVTLTQSEFNELKTSFGEEDTMLAIKILDNYKASSGKQYKSDYNAILKWAMNAVSERKAKRKEKPKNTFELLTMDSQEEFERIMWEKMNRET